VQAAIPPGRETTPAQDAGATAKPLERTVSQTGPYILMIRSTPGAATALDRALTDAGPPIRTAPPDEADRIAREKPPALILTPSDGPDLEAAERLGRDLDLPVLCLPASGGTALLLRFLGADEPGRAVRSALETSRLRNALRLSEERYNDLVENAGSIILRMTPAGQITFFNHFAEDFFGFSSEEILGRDVVGTIVPRHDSSGRDLEKLIRNVGRDPDRHPSSEHENVRKDGERVWVAWTHRALRDADGHVSEILCIGNDISERRRTEKKLAFAARQWRQTFDAIPDCVFIVDRDHHILQANLATRTMFPHRPVEGEHCHQLFHGTDGPIRKCPVCTTFAEGRPVVTEIREPHLGGRFFELAAYPLKDEAGHVTQVVHLARDTTERSHMQRALFLQERLAAVGQLASGIAHDFNNILSIILGYAQILQGRAGVAEPDREALKTIVGQGKRAARLVRQILDFSRQSVSRPIRLEIGSFLKEQARLMRVVVPESIELALDVPAGDYVARVDPTQMQQILTNLVSNARDAMPAGGRLRLAIERVAIRDDNRPFPQMDPGPWLLLTFADNGSGIDSDVLPHIYEPFFTTKGIGEGTGLGLSQVYGLVKQNGGFIDCRSEPGKGTTFLIHLPESEKGRAAVSWSGVALAPVGGGETVLLVEDEPAVREVTAAMLGELAYKVRQAPDGLAALEQCREPENRPDVILADMIMPNITGIALLRTLRELGIAIPVVLMTGYPLDEKSRRFLEDDAAPWLQKPLEPQALARALADALAAPPAASDD
jgi:PAS domain S-box-containing protein